MTERSRPRFQLTRRRMILGGTLAGGALVVGYVATHPMQAVGAVLNAGGSAMEHGPLGPYITVEPDNSVTIVNPQQEMGQGIHAGLAAMIAEEMDADWNRVQVVQGRVDFASYGPQMAGGSNNVASHWDRLRQTGAAAQAMFVAAAAQRWQVPPASIAVADSVVSHPPSRRTATFAELIAEAARQTPPQTPVLKRREEYRLIGTDRVRRKDCLPKSTGRQTYTQDVQLPGMLVACVAHPPRFGGRLAAFDDSAARAVPGVVDVFAISTGVAVLADTTFAAMRGRDALRLQWDESGAERRSSPQLAAWYRDIAAGRAEASTASFAERGAIDQPQGDTVLETTIDFPWLAHAPMEPLDCVAQVDGWDVNLWSGSHHPSVEHVHGALNGRTLPGRVNLTVLTAGGSFGRRGVMVADYLSECVRIAKQTGGRPVKLIWTREDEMQAGYYRPMAHHRISVAVDRNGYPADWRHHIVSQGLLPVGPNQQSTEGVEDSPYFATAGTLDCRISTPDLAVPVAFWRSVGHSHTAMAMEHAIDQLARRAGRDPAQYRRALYNAASAERHVALLDELCRRAEWGTPLEDGWARGMAVHESFGTLVGQVAEVRLDGTRPVVRRVVCAVDCGIAISPDQIAAQVEGSVGFGLSAALYGAVTLQEGIVQQTNFDTYPLVRMNEMPSVETYIMPSTNPPTGMGEPAVPPIAPAVANALLALTGQPTRSLPFMPGPTGVNADV